MTNYICDICNRPMLSLENGSSNFAVTLCGKCAEEESLEDSSLLTMSWDKLKVGTKKYQVYKGKTYICQVAKTRENYVNIEVREKDNQTIFDTIVLTRNYSQNRIDFYLRRFRYRMGYVAREFLLDLLSTHHQEMSSLSQEESIFWEAIMVVQGVGK